LARVVDRLGLSSLYYAGWSKSRTIFGDPALAAGAWVAFILLPKGAAGIGCLLSSLTRIRLGLRSSWACARSG
jgi:hypothetical protein